MPKAEIPTTQATFALEKLHAELAGKVAQNKKEGQRLAQALKHVEATLRLLQPGYNIWRMAIRRRRPNPWFKRGTVFRRALDVLRKADQPMTAREIAIAMVGVKGVKNPEPDELRMIVGAVQASISNHAGKSVVRVGEGMPGRWQVKKTE
jgi:hypothetical protein